MLNDRELVVLYREFSEELWAAGFTRASTEVVREFRGWLTEKAAESRTAFTDYERDMVIEYRRQEAADEG